MSYYGFMNTSNLYWTPPATEIKSALPISGHLGFQIDIPKRDPVSTPWYYGQNALPDRREMSLSGWPELYPVDNVLPTVGGIPRIDPRSFAARVSRSRGIARI